MWSFFLVHDFLHFILHTFFSEHLDIWSAKWILIRCGNFTEIKASFEIISEAENNEDEDEADKTFYMKIGLVFVGTLALVFVVFGLIWAILGSGSDDTDEAPELSDVAEITQSADPTPAIVDSNSVTLFAKGGSVYVTVTQKNDGERIYRGAIEVDSPLTLDKSGPVEIMFTRGEHLVIESGDERFRPSASGAAKITIE